MSVRSAGPDYGTGIAGKPIGPVTSKGPTKDRYKYSEHYVITQQCFMHCKHWTALDNNVSADFFSVPAILLYFHLYFVLMPVNKAFIYINGEGAGRSCAVSIGPATRTLIRACQSVSHLSHCTRVTKCQTERTDLKCAMSQGRKKASIEREAGADYLRHYQSPWRHGSSYQQQQQHNVPVIGTGWTPRLQADHHRHAATAW